MIIVDIIKFIGLLNLTIAVNHDGRVLGQKLTGLAACTSATDYKRADGAFGVPATIICGPHPLEAACLPTLSEYSD